MVGWRDVRRDNEIMTKYKEGNQSLKKKEILKVRKKKINTECQEKSI